ncbi:hypothetical protein H7D62_016795, partial [Brucella melitensis]|uniref:hypothetical protein n=1 Tax=Brucella melitensis TaxID=29459 RepID=UPI001AA01748
AAAGDEAGKSGGKATIIDGIGELAGNDQAPCRSIDEKRAPAADAERYYKDYETAIHAIGRASAGRGIYDGPGISIKLSALHP